jgi:MFS-type transporter involved in bile tolerance (Atg22 family)
LKLFSALALVDIVLASTMHEISASSFSPPGIVFMTIKNAKDGFATTQRDEKMKIFLLTQCDVISSSYGVGWRDSIFPFLTVSFTFVEGKFEKQNGEA